MKIIQVDKTDKRERFYFEHDDGLQSWIDFDENGYWLDGTFKANSQPYREQIEHVDHYHSTTNDDEE